jgi:hypothetical protein
MVDGMFPVVVSFRSVIMGLKQIRQVQGDTTGPRYFMMLILPDGPPKCERGQPRINELHAARLRPGRRHDVPFASSFRMISRGWQVPPEDRCKPRHLF